MNSKDLPGDLLRASETTAFALWQMPAFDDGAANVVQAGDAPEALEAEQIEADEPQVEVEDVAVEAVQPLTLEEVEAVRQDAYNEGFSTGEKEGFQAGQLRARQEADAALQPRLQALESIMQQLFDPIAGQDQAIEHMLLDLVCKISTEVIRRELVLDSSQIGKVIREALKLLPLDDGQVRIYINPQDFDTLKKLRERHEESWRILEDDNLQPGGCRIGTRNRQIDASVETRLQTMMQQLLEQQRHLQSEPVPADSEQQFDLTAASAENFTSAQPLPEPAAELAEAVADDNPVPGGA